MREDVRTYNVVPPSTYTIIIRIYDKSSSTTFVLLVSISKLDEKSQAKRKTKRN